MISPTGCVSHLYHSHCYSHWRSRRRRTDVSLNLGSAAEDENRSIDGPACPACLREARLSARAATQSIIPAEAPQHSVPLVLRLGLSPGP